MIYTALSEKHINNSKYSNLPEIRCTHPRHAKSIGIDISSSLCDFICYDTVLLDYIDIDKIVFIDDNGDEFHFNDKFKKELEYMNAGEIILQRC